MNPSSLLLCSLVLPSTFIPVSAASSSLFGLCTEGDLNRTSKGLGLMGGGGGGVGLVLQDLSKRQEELGGQGSLYSSSMQNNGHHSASARSWRTQIPGLSWCHVSLASSEYKPVLPLMSCRLVPSSSQSRSSEQPAPRYFTSPLRRV